MKQPGPDPTRPLDSWEVMRPSRRRFLGMTGVGLLTASGVLAACGEDDAGTGGGSGSDSGGGADKPVAIDGMTIRFVNYTDWIGKGQYADFKSKEGVTIREIPVNSGRVAKITADPSAADMVLLDLHQAGQLDAAGLLAQFDLKNVPNYGNVDPAFKDGLASDDVAKVLATDYGRTGIMYRKDMVSEPISSWADVWDLSEKYSGKITLLDTDVGTVPVALLSLGLKGNSRSEEELNRAADRLIDIKPHLLALLTGDQVKPLLDGSAVIGAVEDWAGAAAIADNPDGPLEWVNPDPTTGYLDCWGVVRGTDVQPAIEAFANYSFQPKVYANYVNTLSIASIVPDAEPYIDKKLKSNPVTYPESDVYSTVEFQGYLGEGQRYHDEAWEKFKSA
jgi:spermidine/putrescine transport system substrate-binding protein